MELFVYADGIVKTDWLKDCCVGYDGITELGPVSFFSTWEKLCSISLT